MRQHSLRHVWILLAIISVFMTAAAWGKVYGPDWTIGRAVVVEKPSSVRPKLYLKLSLRNLGPPGRVWVRIYGRWEMVKRGTGWQGEDRLNGNHSPWSTPTVKQHRVLPGMRLLGKYSREVSLNQTAILQIPLTVLGTPGRGSRRLEVVVMTASVETDHRFVPFAGYQMPKR